MTLETYQTKINEYNELEIRRDNLVEVLKFYVLFSNVTELSFFEYNYELNNYVYSFSVDTQDKFNKSLEHKGIYKNDVSVILQENGTIYGKMSFDNKPGETEILSELFNKIIIILKKIFLLQKNLSSQDSMLDIFIITDKTSVNFSNQLEKNLDILLNANVSIETSVTSIVKQLKEKVRKSILIYVVENEELLDLDQEILSTLNEFILVIGPSDYNLPLFCGHLNVYKYLSKDDFLPEKIKIITEELQHKVQNKYINKNKIIAVSGISGGVGVTTVAMNMANLLSKRNSDKNVLYIDLSPTKAISNLFLEENPLPKKSIVDLVNSAEYDLEKNLENGLVKVKENFYSINGIQKHIDIDFIMQAAFIEKLLTYISKINDKFNFIIIDTGEANATALNTTIYDISNEIWILTEMSLPHISKLKTFFSLMKRAGLKEKLSFLVNRYDSINAISVSDVTSILNTTKEDNLNFDFKIPNDYAVLGHCWNYCELATNTFPKSVFVKILEDILHTKGFLKENTPNSKSKSWLGLFNKELA